MESVAWGFSTAVLWAVTTLLLSSSSRAVPARSFAFWILFAQAIAVLIPGVVIGATSHWSLAAVALIAFAALLEATGMVAYRYALSQAPVGVVAGLVAIQGAVVAVLSILNGEPLSLLLAVGLGLATAGGLVVGVPREARWMSRSSSLAVLAAALFGVGLWLTTESGLEPLVTVALFNLMSAGLVLAAPGGDPGPRLTIPPRRELTKLLVAGAAGSAGLVTFIVGAHSNSVAVTAVIATQFSVVAAVGGYFLFHERLRARQIVGLVILTLGVSIVAGATA